jgi:hypothetical protein
VRKLDGVGHQTKALLSLQRVWNDLLRGSSNMFYKVTFNGVDASFTATSIVKRGFLIRFRW